MDTHDFAWAAGFFDGEGWANGQGRGVNCRINQASVDGVPEVLTKFRRIVGVGRIKGPVLEEGKLPLYYWSATSHPDLERVASLIGPWLCPTKRTQFERTLRLKCPQPNLPATMSEELAWAGGLFDGEGSTYLDKHRSHPGRFVAVAHVTQAAASGTAPELLRFREVIGVGHISGPSKPKPRRRPYRRWRAVTAETVQLSVHLLWPFIGKIKREQARNVLMVIHSQPDLPRGNPAFGVAGSRFCLRGHDKWSARIRPYVSRGKNHGPNDRRQCLECVREDARRKRNGSP